MSALPFGQIAQFAFYFLPTIISLSKKASNSRKVILLNIFLGWTGIGWVISLVMAIRGKQLIAGTPFQSAAPLKQEFEPVLPPPTASSIIANQNLMTGAHFLGSIFGRIKNLFNTRRHNSVNGFQVNNRNNKRWAWAAIFGLILAVGAVGNLFNKSSEQTVASTTTTTSSTIPMIDWTEILVPGKNASDISASFCKDLDSLISKQAKIIKERISASEKASIDQFDGAAYIKTIDWSTFQHEDNIVNEQLGLSSPLLIANTSTAPSVEQSSKFLNDSIDTCLLAETSKTLLSDARFLDSRMNLMQYKATHLPWYPKGFTEYKGDIAWKWLEHGEFRCSYGDHCWGMLVVAKNGCPSSLYAEITILDGSGSNVGYTNDTTSGLSPGQQAKLIFEDFTPGADSARLGEISCY